MDLVLASTSPYRRALLGRLGVPFRCRAPGVDEDALKAEGLAPRPLAERLALAKALRVAEEEPGAAVIGGDQVVAFQGQVLGKPGSREAAIAQISALAGGSHALITAIAVVHAGQIFPHTDVAEMVMRALSRAEIERYVDADEPFDCAGSYKLESRGIALFERISAADHSAITGLPLIALTSILRGIGARIP